MPWSETNPMSERARFVALHQEGLYSMSELCERFGIARKTGYKWVARFEESGLEGVSEQSRAPRSCPHRTPAAMEQLLREARERHPAWGPRKLLDYLEPRHPDRVFPAPSTVGELLKRAGLVEGKRRRRKHPHPGSVPLQTTAPNQVWCCDFKGQFPTGDGVDCYPLTVTDAHSRFLLACVALPSTQHAGVVPVFERLFAEYGLPEAMRSDNGVPFATVALGGYSKLSVWWLKLGITHQRITPGRPEQNGRYERMHRTLKAATTRPPEADHRAQQARFDAFREEYNQERPHAALAGKTPGSQYLKSERSYPGVAPEPEYPKHFLVRRVSRAGNFRMHNQQVFASIALVGELLGLEETEDREWSVYLGPYLLGRLREENYRLQA
jgi:transposase InsO family protein